MEEAKLIDWPTVGTAASQTGIVIALMIGSTAALLAVNAGLAQLSQVIF